MRVRQNKRLCDLRWMELLCRPMHRVCSTIALSSCSCVIEGVDETANCHHLPAVFCLRLIYEAYTSVQLSFLCIDPLWLKAHWLALHWRVIDWSRVVIKVLAQAAWRHFAYAAVAVDGGGGGKKKSFFFYFVVHLVIVTIIFLLKPEW